MSSKLTLLQKLLLDREELVILHDGKALCSCGSSFDDLADIENHLVQQHEKLPDPTFRKSSLKEILASIISSPQKSLDNDVFLHLELPTKVVAVCLEEDDIGGGHIRDYSCNECSVPCWSFKTLKDHFCRQHPGTWASPTSIKGVERILFQKPSKRDARQIPKDWCYHYYCPLPGCKYHINQHSSRQNLEPGCPKFFPSLSLLKQHYLKLHAFKSRVCESCSAAFASDVYLRRHKKVACGRSFSCPSCQTTFSALENLQTHCRRKGHNLPRDFCVTTITASEKKEKTSLPSPSRRTFEHDSSQRKYVKIAPMPSLTMTAAIALSELSTSANKNQQQQRDPFTAANASTTTAQTSPRGDDPEEMQADVEEESLKRTGSTSAGIPKLGEIEQFSTETQTDDLEILLKPSAAEDAFTIEAQTQFDLDDILCSNYTQTALFDISMDQSTSTNNMNSIETQTMLITADDLVHMETQTMSMFFEDEVENS